MRKLADDRASGRVLDEEAHEPRAVVGLLVVLGEEEVTELGRHASHDGIVDDEGASLRELDPFVHVDAGVLAAHHVLGRRLEEPPAKSRQRNRQDAVARNGGGATPVPRAAIDRGAQRPRRSRR